MSVGGPQSLNYIVVDWEAAYAIDYQVQVSADRNSWTTVKTITGKSSPDADTHSVGDVPNIMGVRYLRIYCTQRVPNYDNFSIYYVRVFRKPMVISSNPTGLFCGGTITEVTNYLLGTYGGNLIHVYENAEFFSASLSAAQESAMFEDREFFIVYVVSVCLSVV